MNASKTSLIHSARRLSPFMPLRLLGRLALLASLHVPLSQGAETEQKLYGEPFQREGAVVTTQSRVVMYRSDDGGKQAAHVYIDGHLQGALLPGGYSVFCTLPGEHSVEAYTGDAPVYSGKRDPQSFATLAGGQTYVLEVPLGANSTPIVHTGVDAEQSLQGLRRQDYVLSRAAAVVPCQTQTRLSLRSDVLFPFNKSGYADLTAEGRAQLGQVVGDIQQRREDITSIEVVGHADPIGRVASNQRLSEQRAETVRQVLLEQGIPRERVQASGRGSSEPVVHCLNGSRSEKIACNAPNRRVELLIQGQQNGQ